MTFTGCTGSSPVSSTIYQEFMANSRSVSLLLTLGFLVLSPNLRAEDLQFNLYLNVGFVNIQAGTASITQKQVVHDGRNAVMTSMLMSTNTRADRVYPMRDTIQSINTPRGESLYFRKCVHEGSKNNIETALFSRSGDNYVVNMNQTDALTGERKSHATEWRPERIYDLMSMLSYARTIDTANSEPGRTESLPMVNGTMVVQQYLVYTGNTQIKADNGTSYDCMVISVRDYKEGKERETVRAYVTNDKAHLPIQLDIKAGVATIKAVLK